MRFVDFLNKQPSVAILLFGLLLVGALGFADYATGPEMFFLEFYLLPVLLVAWFAGERAGILVSVASAVSWFIDEVVGRSPHSQPAVPYWNVGVKFLVFVFFTHMVMVFKEALERERRAEQETVRREMEIARQVQKRLFPQILPPMSTLDYAGMCMPANGVGGDYYDFLELGDTRLAIAVGDVSGKGISSALLMASLQGMWRSHAFLRSNEVSNMMAELNHFLFASTDKKRFVTFFSGVYDDSSRRLTYVNAGHNPPMILRTDLSGISEHWQPHAACQVRRLEASGIVLGVLPNAAYTESTVDLFPGDVLVCFTDGVTEAVNANGEEFGEERVLSLVASHLNLPAVELQDLILENVRTFAGPQPQHDDITLAVLRVV